MASDCAAESGRLYADVNVILTESLLRVEADGESGRRIRTFGSALLRDAMVSIPGAQECKAIAPLIILRFGDRRSLPLLLKCVEDDSGRNPPAVVRSCAFVYASFGPSEYRDVRKAASKLFKSPLPEAIRMIERIQRYGQVPDRYKNRLTHRTDAVSGKGYVDMRSVLTARLLALSPNAAVKSWLRDWRTTIDAAGISTFDRKTLRRLVV